MNFRLLRDFELVSVSWCGVSDWKRGIRFKLHRGLGVRRIARLGRVDWVCFT